VGGSPTSSSRQYRRNRLIVLANSDLCGICGHGGAMTTDHIVSFHEWPPGVPGLDDVANLQPSHGTLGAGHIHNPCPECGRMCNQSKGNRAPAARSPRSQDW
jgi:5-methylcytosine-specific restriction endonuclease McrA